ncbi:MAG: LacI family DNA-binding transcriptional regulator [Sphingomonas sp.]
MARTSRRGSRAVTMADVAARAGVSTMTVSNVINETGRVSAATRRTVRAAIDALGYLPDTAARHLASAGATRLGMLYQHARSDYVSDALVAALDTASARGVQLIVRDCGEADAPAVEAEMLGLAQRGAQAILLLPPFAEMVTGRPAPSALGLPLAAIGTGGPLPDMSTVRIDEHAAAHAMTEALIARGHRRIGFIAGPPAHSSAMARREGHEAALRAHDLAVDPDLCVSGDYMFESGLAAARQLLDRPNRPTAIFAGNDEMAAAVTWVAHSMGLSVPEELAVAGFDDAPLATKVFPALSAVRQPVGTLARQATELLLEAIRTPDEPPRDELVPFELVMRQSTGG